MAAEGSHIDFMFLGPPYPVAVSTTDHSAGSSINSVFFEEIKKFWMGFTVVVYEKYNWNHS